MHVHCVNDFGSHLDLGGQYVHDFGSHLDLGGLGVCACLALVVILTSVVSVGAYNMTSV